VVVHSSAQLVKHPVVVVWLQLLVGVVVSFDVLFDVCWVWVDFGDSSGVAVPGVGLLS